MTTKRFDLDLDRARNLARASDRGLVHAHDLARKLVWFTDDAARTAGELEQLSDDAGAVPAGGNAAVWPQRVCRGLVAVAARVVPAGHRARYEQEWRAELWELGEQPRPRRHQLRYAFGVLSRCVALRRGLTRPVPGRAAGGGSAEG